MVDGICNHTVTVCDHSSPHVMNLHSGLSNVEVIWARAEEAGRRPELRETYDLAVARAVAETRVLAELCLPFVRVGGLWVAPKGPGPQAEVESAGNAIKKLGGKLVALDMVDSFSADGQRTAVVVRKVNMYILMYKCEEPPTEI